MAVCAGLRVKLTKTGILFQKLLAGGTHTHLPRGCAKCSAEWQGKTRHTHGRHHGPFIEEGLQRRLKETANSLENSVLWAKAQSLKLTALSWKIAFSGIRVLGVWQELQDDKLRKSDSRIRWCLADAEGNVLRRDSPGHSWESPTLDTSPHLTHRQVILWQQPQKMAQADPQSSDKRINKGINWNMYA